MNSNNASMIIMNLLKIITFFIPIRSIRRKLRLQIYNFIKYYIFLFFNKRFIKKKIKECSKKKIIKVGFFVIHESVWKYDLLYKEFLKDPRFKPFIIVAPQINFGKEHMISTMNNCYDFFKSKNYETYKSFDKKIIYIDKILDLDIIFFTNPHPLTDFRYRIDYWYNKAITYYTPYTLTVSKLIYGNYNQDFYYLVHRIFEPTILHREMAKKYSINYIENRIITGYPKLDIFFDNNYKPKNLWKKNKLIKIIWSPHHSIENGKECNHEEEIEYSTFLKNYSVMLDIVKKYEDKIQFCLKPHPLLKPKLYQHKDWGKRKTDEYFKLWNNMKNSQVNTSEYEDLFITSDAIINDSASFVAEFLCVDKPSLFLLRNHETIKQFNRFGKIALKASYKAYNSKQIIDFIDNVVIKKIDIHKNLRKQFKNKYLSPMNNTSSSRAIYDCVRNELFNNE